MNAEKRRQIQSWLRKSNSDPGSARQLLEGPRPFLDTAVFHCQQTAEKVLKAFLTYHDIPFAKTHDLNRVCQTGRKRGTCFWDVDGYSPKTNPLCCPILIPW
jgi:HEPN domain-containing protein